MKKEALKGGFSPLSDGEMKKVVGGMTNKSCFGLSVLDCNGSCRKSDGSTGTCKIRQAETNCKCY